MARRFVQAELAESPLDVDTAVLLVSELVTNAVLHARSPFRVLVEPGEEAIRVEVYDGSPVPPRVHTFAPTSATGRGLRLLDRLAQTWGVTQLSDGKSVWFEVGPAEMTVWESFVDDEFFAHGVGHDL